jgi:2'-5' RNA ligase
MSGRSAVIVPIELPPDLRALRDGSDPMAARGVPAHVTILFPFLPADALGAEIHTGLARIAADSRPWTARFDQVQCREGRVWLVPADQAPFIGLTMAVAARWPEYPPYGGVHDELIAHLTMVETSNAGPVEAVCAAARASAPFEFEVTELSVLAEDEAGRWHTERRIPLGRPTTRVSSANLP